MTASSRQYFPWIVVALIAALGGLWLARATRTSPPALAAGTWLPAARVLPDFRLVDSTDRPFTPQSLHGHPSVMFFGFTHCPDVCPTTLALLAMVKRQAAVPGLVVYFTSVDPERDTPAALAQYVQAFDRKFIGITGTPPDIAAFTRSAGIAFARVALPGGGYTMDHSASLLLFDARGRIVAVFTPPFSAQAIAADLRTAAPRLT